MLGNLIVGVVGSVLGSFTASLIGLAATGLLGELLVAVAGAILFLWLVNYFSGKKN
ncbi:GlsB/YeaQ/YmgE family stress response membrane protein [Planctomycetaceae bacterium]|nr:GlsB/YeaQ/YmgE family stress response membrane protein [Planctomycetaceae bacterium]MDG2388004.1 GlsB/YeaQ/YmgE family stress response membrane protein [Planctomycetaceae bacterium]